jgi:ectoine hydroxylase-related dioxygenase (phytanoyl-CoA dioxygenase family)
MERLGARFKEDGYAVLPDVLSDGELGELSRRAVSIDADGVGTRRLLEQPWCVAAARALRSKSCMTGILQADAVAVQCTYFDKSANHNWLVALHQDLSIPVSTRVSDPSCTRWSEKEGTLFVQPPVDVLEQLVAIRVHLDDNTPSNGPLRVVPGSHRSGRVSPEQAQLHRLRLGERECLSAAGSVVAMRPLILHASSKASEPAKRRVFHFVFGPLALPGGLGWKHAV